MSKRRIVAFRTTALLALSALAAAAAHGQTAHLVQDLDTYEPAAAFFPAGVDSLAAVWIGRFGRDSDD